MKNLVSLILLATTTGVSVNGQNLKSAFVPVSVKSALLNKYPEAKNASWEKEKGNF